MKSDYAVLRHLVSVYRATLVARQKTLDEHAAVLKRLSRLNAEIQDIEAKIREVLPKENKALVVKVEGENLLVQWKDGNAHIMPVTLLP